MGCLDIDQANIAAWAIECLTRVGRRHTGVGMLAHQRKWRRKRRGLPPRTPGRTCPARSCASARQDGRQTIDKVILQAGVIVPRHAGCWIKRDDDVGIAVRPHIGDWARAGRGRTRRLSARETASSSRDRAAMSSQAVRVPGTERAGAFCPPVPFPAHPATPYFRYVQPGAQRPDRARRRRP